MSRPARDAARARCVASIIVPAHNEGPVIGRLLAALVVPGVGPFDIVVVCNGCTDDTANVARSAGPDITVIELAEPSKHAALVAGNDAASVFPRLFIDADVEIDASGAARLAERLVNEPRNVLAAAPARRIPRDRTSWLVGAYYDVWEQLPAVRSGLFGRGVVAVSREGWERMGEIPAVMGDDLVISESFHPSERTVVENAVVTIHPPRNARDLHRRRVRAATGNAQADAGGLRRPESGVSLRDVARLAREQPRLIVRVPVFVGMSVAGRIGARRAVRRGDFTTWARDESSRS